jgi:hypothetical protein
LENPAKIEPNPLQKQKQPTQNQGAQSKRGFAPLIEQKNQRIWGFLEKLGFGWVGDKMGNLGIWVAGGEWVRWRMAGGGVLVVGVAVGGGGCGFILDLGRR